MRLIFCENKGTKMCFNRYFKLNAGILFHDFHWNVSRTDGTFPVHKKAKSWIKCFVDVKSFYILWQELLNCETLSKLQIRLLFFCIFVKLGNSYAGGVFFVALLFFSFFPLCDLEISVFNIEVCFLFPFEAGSNRADSSQPELIPLVAVDEPSFRRLDFGEAVNKTVKFLFHFSLLN